MIKDLNIFINQRGELGKTIEPIKNALLKKYPDIKTTEFAGIIRKISNEHPKVFEKMTQSDTNKKGEYLKKLLQKYK